MSQNALKLVLRSLDGTSRALFGYEDVRRWPRGAVEGLVRAGLLRDTGFASVIACDGCEEACIERVELIDNEAGDPPRAYVVCTERDDTARVHVDLARLQQWEASGSRLADLLAGLLGNTGGVEEMVPSRLWWLGAVHHGGRRMDVFLASGAGAEDAPTVFGTATRLRECSAPVVLVPRTVPERSPFPGGAVTLSLERLLTLEKGHLRLGVGEIAAAHGKQRPKRLQATAHFPTPPGTTWEQVVIEFVGDDRVRAVAGSVEDHKSFSEMGFADRRKPQEEPDKLWLLLRVLAKREGRLSWEDEGLAMSGPEAFTKRQVSDLRLRLRRYFGINDDPFKPYHQAKGYETRFVLNCSDSYRRSHG